MEPAPLHRPAVASPLPSDRGPTAWLAARARTGAPGAPSRAVRWLLESLGPLTRLFFRPRLQGWERLPGDRPVLVVANHSGSGIADVLCLATLALERDPLPRLTGMAHPVAFWVPGVRWFLRQVGAIPSTYDHAGRALGDGVSVLVFPGGDHEAFRPLWQAGRVDFNGRKGFLRLARAAGVSIVPLGIWGTHFTQPILWRSGLLAWFGLLPRAAGVKRLPVTLPWLAGLVAIATLAPGEVGPAGAVGLVSLWTASTVPFFLPLLPWPVRMTLGAPLAPEDLFHDDDPDLERAYARVVGEVQAAVDTARAGGA